MTNVGVRWQAQMEDALGEYRERMHVLGRMSFSQPETREIMAIHATAAAAAATAALALAVANVGS